MAGSAAGSTSAGGAGFVVTGFAIGELVARDWGGELWSARGRATGREVRLRRLAVADDVATHDRLRREAARLVGFEHPHVVALRGVLSAVGAVVLVHDHVAGQRLHLLLAERTLDEQQVVTLAVPLAQALAALHARGVLHGRVTSATVLLADSGRPLLADTGVAALLDHAGRVTSAADDVRDLALTCLAALAPACRAGPLATLLTAATDDDATGRPAAAELARALFDTGPAAPILPAGSTPTPEQPPMPPATPRSVARHRRARRVPYRSHPRWVAALVAAMAAVAAALTGLAWAGAQPGAPGATVAARAPATSYADPALSGRWRSVLVALDGRRAAAFATGKVDALVAVYAAGSPALRRDQRQLHELSSAGLHIERLRLRPSSVRVTTTSDSRVVLTVVDVLEPYDIRTARGALVASRPGRGPTRWQVTLARDGGEWRVDDVVTR